MSSMINEKVDISPQSSTRVDLTDTMMEDGLHDMVGQTFVQVSFRLTIGDLVDSEIMQLYPFDFAKLIYTRFRSTMEGGMEETAASEPEPAPQPEPVAYDGNATADDERCNADVQYANAECTDSAGTISKFCTESELRWYRSGKY